MQVVIGLEDFKRAFEGSKEIGKWESWYKYYYLQYKTIFDNQLKYLYMGDISLYKRFVEELDFEKAIAEAETLIRNGIVTKVTSELKRAQYSLEYSNDYRVYLLVGFGHVDGTAFISEMPYVYYGLETLGKVDLKYLVPHEFNHMIHIEANINNFTGSAYISVGDYLILEGLGTIFPLWMNNKDFGRKDLKDALMVREDTYTLMQQNHEEYLMEIMNVFNEELNANFSQKYFIYNSSERVNSRPVKLGYYIGSCIILNLLDSGYSLKELTSMNSQKVYKLYIENVVSKGLDRH